MFDYAIKGSPASPQPAERASSSRYCSSERTETIQVSTLEEQSLTSARELHRNPRAAKQQDTNLSTWIVKKPLTQLINNRAPLFQ